MPHATINHRAANAKMHGYITAHIDDGVNNAAALGALNGKSNAIQRDEQVLLAAARDVDSLIVQYVEDNAPAPGRSMDEFHNVLGAIAAEYLTTRGAPAAGAVPPRNFAWVHWL